MKTFYAFILGSILLISASCQSQDYDGSNYGESDHNQSNYSQANYDGGNSNQSPSYGQASNYTTTQQNRGAQGNLAIKTISKQTGEVIAQMPLPASWKINPNPSQNAPAATGPGGIEIRSFSGRSFVFCNDQYMNQTYQQSGQKVRRPTGVEVIIKQDLMRDAGQQGLKFEKMYNLPGLAQKDKEYSDKLYTYGQQQKQFQVAGVEFSGKDGLKELLIVHYFETYATGMYLWGYTVQNLSAPAQNFEPAKNAYLNGLRNLQHNPSAIASHNQREQAALSANDRAFQTRMRNNQANFEASQQAHVNSSNAINDAQMSIYNTQKESFDRGNQQMMNGIREESTIYNSTNGETYQVEGQSNNYWMNANGEYIPTDDYNYNPNLDQNYNQTEWVEGEPR